MNFILIHKALPYITSRIATTRPAMILDCISIWGSFALRHMLVCVVIDCPLHYSEHQDDATSLREHYCLSSHHDSCYRTVCASTPHLPFFDGGTFIGWYKLRIYAVMILFPAKMSNLGGVPVPSYCMLIHTRHSSRTMMLFVNSCQLKFAVLVLSSSGAAIPVVFGDEVAGSNDRS